MDREKQMERIVKERNLKKMEGKGFKVVEKIVDANPVDGPMYKMEKKGK